MLAELLLQFVWQVGCLFLHCLHFLPLPGNLGLEFRMNELLGNLNHYSSLLLLFIAVGVWAGALALFSLKSSIECLLSALVSKMILRWTGSSLTGKIDCR